MPTKKKPAKTTTKRAMRKQPQYVTKPMLERILDDRFAAQDARIDAKFDARFAEQDARIDAKFDARFAEQDARIDAKFDARFAAQDAKFDARFSQQDAKLEAMEHRLSAELASHTRTILEYVAGLIRVVDDKYADLPGRVAVLEAKVTG